ncbi:AbiU2 domain-containing protein [Sphingobium limneticum]
MPRVPDPVFTVQDVIDRLRHDKRRIMQAVAWARAVNEVWRTFNRHEGRQEVADSHASSAASVYERATLDAQIMMVARVFDRPGRGHIYSQNRMSFPVCLGLLKMPGVMGQLLDESEGWNELEAENRPRVQARYQAFSDTLDALEHEQPNRIELIKGFRDENIAHELRFDVLPQRPQYDHIHGIVDEASLLVSHLSMVVAGEVIHWNDGDMARSATWLWDAVANAERHDR